MTNPTVSGEMVSSELRPRRSVLYMPSSNERALEKARDIPTDALIFDLEDAVAPDAKEAARRNAVAAASSGDYGQREITIRCNGLDTPWGADDIAAAAASGAAAIVIPKVGSTAYLDDVSARLDAAGAPATMTVWAMIETSTAIFDIRAIAGHHRVNVLVMGTNDLAKELRTGTAPDREPLLPHLATAVLGARGRAGSKAICQPVRHGGRGSDGGSRAMASVVVGRRRRRNGLGQGDSLNRGIHHGLAGGCIERADLVKAQVGGVGEDGGMHLAAIAEGDGRDGGGGASLGQIFGGRIAHRLAIGAVGHPAQRQGGGGAHGAIGIILHRLDMDGQAGDPRCHGSGLRGQRLRGGGHGHARRRGRGRHGRIGDGRQRANQRLDDEQQQHEQRTTLEPLA